MKKFLLMFAAVAAIAFVGCKTETKPAEEAAPAQEEQVTEEYTVEGVTTDLMKLVETGDEAQTLGFLDGIKAKADEFLKAGENDKYFNIINILKTVWENNKEAILAKIPTLAEKMSNYVTVPENMKAGFDAFVANAAQNIANKAGEAVDKAGETVDKAGEAVTDKANEVVDDAKAKAADGLNKAAEELKK